MVPQSFRYEEIPAGASEEELFSSARTSVSAQEGSVIVLDVPTGLVEVTPGFKVDPATLLAASTNTASSIWLWNQPQDWKWMWRM